MDIGSKNRNHRMHNIKMSASIANRDIHDSYELYSHGTSNDVRRGTRHRLASYETFFHRCLRWDDSIDIVYLRCLRHFSHNSICYTKNLTTLWSAYEVITSRRTRPRYTELTIVSAEYTERNWMGFLAGSADLRHSDG
jgi:hypothetical protein